MTAQVVKIRPRPWNCWSGVAICTENVVYDVQDILKGDVPARQILVAHLLLRGSLTAALDPGLSRVLFQQGNVLLLFLEPATAAQISEASEIAQEGVDYADLDADCGTILAGEGIVGFVKKYIHEDTTP